jgi:hypothetical protein
MKENYTIFVKWLAATDWILDTVEKYPKSVRFTISNRISNLTLDIMECIVEAIYTKERSHILGRVNVYIEKLRILFRISFMRKYISERQYEYVSGLIDETGRMLGGWKKEK